MFLRYDTYAPASDAECSVEIVDRQVRVRASYRENTVRHVRDNWVEASCALGPLEPGTWTLVYDGEEQDFVVGEPSPQLMACVGNSWE